MRSVDVVLSRSRTALRTATAIAASGELSGIATRLGPASGRVDVMVDHLGGRIGGYPIQLRPCRVIADSGCCLEQDRSAGAFIVQGAFDVGYTVSSCHGRSIEESDALLGCSRGGDRPRAAPAG